MRASAPEPPGGTFLRWPLTPTLSPRERASFRRVVWLLATLTFASHAHAACSVTARATIPLIRAGGLFLVPVELNGSTAQFVLDTGTERSVVGLAAADRLHVSRDEWVSTDLQGTGGRERRRLGRPASLSFGGVALRRRTVAQDNSLVVGPIPDHAGNQPIDGLLGQDFLSTFDLDLDAGSSRLTLYSVTGCQGRYLPWPMPYAAVAAWRPVRNILAVPIHVDGVALEAELDSGTATSVITLPGMLALNLPVAAGPDRVVGFGPGSLPASSQRFDRVQVGALAPAPATLTVAPIRTMRSLGALLGADWLASQRVWLSWATDQVFVATAR